MKLLEGKLIEKSKANTFFILLKFEGGDADTKHDEIEFIKGVNALNYLEPENQTKIFERIEFLNLVKQLSDPHFNYDEIEAEYGEDVARFMDNIPNDPQADYQFKCCFDDFELRYYDSESNLFCVKFVK